MALSSHEVFEEWVARVRPGLVSSARALLKDEAEAENIAQATLLAVWDAHRQGALEHLDHYARRAVWTNALRHRARRRDWVPLEAAGELSIDAGASELTSWELERAIADLPPAQQVVLRLRFYGGLSFKEIGQALTISMNTAASRCRYALDTLRRGFRAAVKQEKVNDESRD
ncbi:MAG: RNA polymerase sigma factor [Myxococcaceae bacterium]